MPDGHPATDATAAPMPLPSATAVGRFIDDLLGSMFPQRAEASGSLTAAPGAHRERVENQLRLFVAQVSDEDSATRATRAVIAALPAICDGLAADAAAMAEGDPAAESVDEVIVAYPGFQAVAIHRVAHALRAEGVPLIPRLLAEVAHSRTGIDIHPGATIGSGFRIDHGTGVVIGETAVIGNDVTIYQGVTLGALSVRNGTRGLRRHPTIEDRVVLYAHATILGSDTVIGHDSVIGGNVWLTTSVPAHSFVYQPHEVRVRRVADLADPTDYSI